MPEILKTRFEDFGPEGADILMNMIRYSKNDMVRMKGIEMLYSYIMPKAAVKVEHNVNVTFGEFLIRANSRHKIVDAAFEEVQALPYPDDDEDENP